MAGRSVSTLAQVLIASGFLLWAYGFYYSSFWYAETGPSLLEPVREWVHHVAGVSLKPGITEEILGLGTSLAGIFIRVKGL